MNYLTLRRTNENINLWCHFSRNLSISHFIMAYHILLTFYEKELLKVGFLAVAMLVDKAK